MLFDDTADMPAMLLRIAAFFRDESCGQCVPCRVGTVRQEEALERLVAATAGTESGPGLEDRAGGHDRAAELALLADLGQVMRDASICGLGQTAANAIDSALRHLDPFGATGALR